MVLVTPFNGRRYIRMHAKQERKDIMFVRLERKKVRRKKASSTLWLQEEHSRDREMERKRERAKGETDGSGRWRCLRKKDS